MGIHHRILFKIIEVVCLFPLNNLCLRIKTLIGKRQEEESWGSADGASSPLWPQGLSFFKGYKDKLRGHAAITVIAP